MTKKMPTCLYAAIACLAMVGVVLFFWRPYEGLPSPQKLAKVILAFVGGAQVALLLLSLLTKEDRLLLPMGEAIAGGAAMLILLSLIGFVIRFFTLRIGLAFLWAIVFSLQLIILGVVATLFPAPARRGNS